MMRLPLSRQPASTVEGGAKVPKCLDAVLQTLMGKQDFDKFADLKEARDDQKRVNLVLEHEGFHPAKAAEFTPRLIKELRPKVPASYLNWQPSWKQFAGYYPKPAKMGAPSKRGKIKKTGSERGNLHSTARQYGGKWSQHQALCLVVAQLWKWHAKSGKVTWKHSQV